jgi:RNA polymerase sigma-70 factor (ECF subfamily)
MGATNERHDEFTEFWQQTCRKVRAYMFCACHNPSDADDLTQDCYMRALGSWDAFQSLGSRQAWLFAIARSTQVDWIRKKRRRKRDFEEQSGREEPQAPAEPGREETEAIWIAVARLGPDHWEVVHLRFAAGLSYAEIAEALGLPVGTVRSRLFRSLQALREFIEE